MLNYVLLPIFLTKTIVLDGHESATEILKIFVKNILERGSEAAATNESGNKEEDELEDNDETTSKTVDGKVAA